MAMRIEDSPKRVRAFLHGEPVVDSFATRLVWEHDRYPVYYFPEADVRAERVPAGALHRYEDERAGLVHVDWGAMDAWFEEDEEVYVHPRSPYSRVDILDSSRHVCVTIDGVVVAETRRPRLLFETGLRTRYYVPLTDVRMDLLRPSDLVTRCPYKGTASYWSVEVDGRLHENVVWTYKTPLPESIRVAGLACFYQERTDLTVDGAQAR
jgi:uncharacterized protein (DUF427 family)